MEPKGKAATNAVQVMEQATTAAVSAASAIASARVARAADTCACCRKGCPACDMLAKVHTGEAIVPHAFIPMPDIVSILTELVAEVRALSEAIKMREGVILEMQERIAKILSRWDDDGFPLSRPV